MRTVLVTGASGFIATHLRKPLEEAHNCIWMSRGKSRDAEMSILRGDFSEFEDLRQLDNHEIDAVIHLGAVTGGCTERDGVLVNGEGTRCLMRYLIDRGCKKFVMASSIALVGMQHRDFRPLSLPIPDDHPCLDRDGYGFSKHLMEQVTHYYARQNPDIDVLNLRLTSVAPDDAQPRGMRPLGQWALGGITVTLVSDIVKLLVAAVDGPHAAGVRTFNAGSSRAWATVPTAELLENWWGDAVDRSYYLKPGHECDSAYDMSAVEQEFGWKAENTLKRLEEQ